MWDKPKSTTIDILSIGKQIQPDGTSSMDPVLFTPLKFINNINVQSTFDKRANLSQSAPRPSTLTKLFTNGNTNCFHLLPISTTTTTTTTTPSISRSSSCTRTTLISSDSSIIALSDDTLVTSQGQMTKATTTPIDKVPDSSWSVDYKSLHGLSLYPECRGLKFTDCPKPQRVNKTINLASRQAHTPPPDRGRFCCMDDLEDDDDDDDEDRYRSDSDSESDDDDYDITPITLTSTKLHNEREEADFLQFDNDEL